MLGPHVFSFNWQSLALTIPTRPCHKVRTHSQTGETLLMDCRHQRAVTACITVSHASYHRIIYRTRDKDSGWSFTYLFPLLFCDLNSLPHQTYPWNHYYLKMPTRKHSRGSHLALELDPKCSRCPSRPIITPPLQFCKFHSQQDAIVYVWALYEPGRATPDPKPCPW